MCHHQPRAYAPECTRDPPRDHGLLCALRSEASIGVEGDSWEWAAGRLLATKTSGSTVGDDVKVHGSAEASIGVEGDSWEWA